MTPRKVQVDGVAVALRPGMAELLALLRRLADDGSGMPTQTALAEHSGREPWQINEDLADLVRVGALVRLVKGGKGHRSAYRITATGQLLAADEPVRLGVHHAEGSECRQRRCLKCRHEFLSAHKGNRICGPCAASNAWHDTSSFALALPGTHTLKRPLRASIG